MVAPRSLSDRPALQNRALSAARFHLVLRPLRTILYLATPVAIGRYLAPDDYGAFTVVFALICLVEGLCLPGITPYLVRSQTTTQASALFWLSLSLRFFVAGGLLVLAKPVSVLMGTESLTLYLQALSPWLILEGARTVPDALLTRELSYGKRFVALFASDLVGILLLLYGLHAGWGIWSLFARAYASSTLGILLNTFFLRWRPFLIWKLSDLRSLLQLNRDVTITRLSGRYLESIDSLILSALCGVSSAGFFGMSAKFALLPLQQFFWPAGELVLPIGTHYIQREGDLRNLFIRFTSSILFVSLPFMLILAFTAPHLTLLLGPEWFSVTEIVPVLCALGAALCFAPASSFYVLSKTTALDSTFALLQGILMTAGLAVGSRWNLLGAVYGFALMGCLAIAIRVFASLKKFQISLMEYWEGVRYVLLANVGLGGLLWTMRALLPRVAPVTAVGLDCVSIILGTTGYLLIFRRTEMLGFLLKIVPFRTIFRTAQ